MATMPMGHMGTVTEVLPPPHTDTPPHEYGRTLIRIKGTGISLIVLYRNDQKAAENDIEWFHRIQKFIANGNNDYS